MTEPQPTDPRQLAARLVAGVVNGGAMLPEVPLPPEADPASRARAQRLALTTLRNLARADAVLRPLLRREPPAEVLAALRVATVEMLELGAAPHGVVNGVVGALGRTHGSARGGARSGGRKAAGMAGMANAVLRRASEFRGWHELPVQRLPGWLRRRLKPTLGEDRLRAIEAAHHAGAPIDLTLKPGAKHFPDGTRLPNGSLRIAAGVQVSALPGFAEGDWWVQDAAASLPATLLTSTDLAGDLAPGARVLDLCAAPGGKTMQLAAAGARVTALDLSEARLARLRENLARTRLPAEVVCADALDWTPPAPFDAVLLDAPCSATGTIRRHPDLPFARKPADLAALTELQARLIDRALTLLVPGGRLVYCTCSLLPEEGEDQIAAALARHADLRVLAPSAMPFGRATPEGGWRTLPPDLPGGVDGFYMALLCRAGG